MLIKHINPNFQSKSEERKRKYGNPNLEVNKKQKNKRTNLKGLIFFGLGCPSIGSKSKAEVDNVERERERERL